MKPIPTPRSFRLSALLLLSLWTLSSCTSRYREQQAEQTRVSQEAIAVQRYTDEEEERYQEKIQALEDKRHRYDAKALKKFKLEFVLYALRSIQNVIGAVPIPIVSQGINLGIDKTVDTYFLLERLNKKMERNTGISVEVEDKSASLEFSRPF